MDELQCAADAVLGHLGERQPPLLARQATVAQLARVLDVLQPAYHLLYPSECVEA